MRLGFVSAMFADLGFDEVIDIAAREGYGSVEIMCWPVGKAERRYAGITHIDVDKLDDPGVAKIRAKIDASGVGISGLGYYPNPLDGDEEKASFYRDHLKKVIDGAAKLGVPVVNTFIGRDHTKSLDENKKRFAKSWPGIIAHAEKAGIKIGIENCPMFFSSDEWPGGKNMAFSPAIWRWMFAEIDSDHFGLNYDPSHMVWQRMDYLAPLEEFRDKIFHVHLKDARVDESRLKEVGIMATPLEYHTPKLPGLGDVDWGKFCSILTGIGYDGDVVVEVEDRAYEGSMATRIAAIRQVRSFIRRYLPV